MKIHLLLASIAGPFLFAGLLTAQTPLNWKPAARMQTARVDHCAVALDDGRIFIAGGTGADGPLASVELYGPGDAFAPGASMSMARSGHACTKLQDGRVLVTGGSDTGEAEIFNPLVGDWIPVRGAATLRGSTATLLPNGTVVVVGGTVTDAAGTRATDRISIFNPDTGAFREASGGLLEPRTQHTAVALSDGRVFLAGGTRGQQVLSSTEIFDPSREKSVKAAPLAVPRVGHATAMLPDGRILIAGGFDGSAELDSVEVYHPDEGRMEMLVAGLWARVRDPFLSVIPATGMVLIAGGQTAGTAVPTTQLFEPWSNRFLPVGPLTAPRTRIAGAALEDGVIFATGGKNDAGPSAACGVFSSGPILTLSVNQGGEVLGQSLTSTSFSLNQTLRVSGSRFAANTNVTFTLRRPDGTTLNNRLLTTFVRTSASGTFAVDFFNTAVSDAGSQYLLRAVPAASGIIDGSSNTITIGEAVTVEASFDIKLLLNVSVEAVNRTVVAGQPIPLTFKTSAPIIDGPLTANPTLTVGPVSATPAIASLLPGTDFPTSVCCVDTPGTYSPSAFYPGDAKYSRALSLLFSDGVTVISNQPTLGLSSASVPLFTPLSLTVQIRAATAGVPSPTGSVVVTHTSAVTPDVTKLALSRDLRSPVAGAIASFSFKAQFLDKPNSCFKLEYSGDTIYKPVTTSLCIPTTPAVPTLEITAPTDTFTFGTPFPVSVKLTFPPELGLVTRVLHLTPPNQDFKINIGVGSADLSTNLLLPFAEQAITASYSGGGDVGSARALFALRMKPADTKVTLDALPSSASNPLSLRAVVRSVVPVGVTSAGATPVPAGTVQFFDGDVILGQVQATALSDGGASASLPNVSRPVGTRSFRAIYLGTPQFAGSTSPTVSVTIR